MEKEIKEIIALILDIDVERVTESALLYKDLNCDSLDFVEIMMEIEDTFDIDTAFDFEKINHHESVQDVIDFVKGVINGTRS